MSRNLSRLLVLSVLILAIFSFPQIIQTARAQLTGKVCIGPDIAAQTSCPATPVALTGPVTTGPSTLVRVQVFISVTDPINGFEVTLLLSHLVGLPVGVDLTGSIVGNGPTTLLECLQNVAIIGGPCTSTDTLDTIHLAVVAAPGALPGGTTPPGASGLLFTAIYSIQGATTTPTTIGFQSGCAVTSLTGTTTCINISNGTKVPVPETAQTGTLSTTTTQPAVQLSPNGGSLGAFFSGVSPPAQVLTITDVGGAYLASGQSDGGGDTSYTLSTSITGPTSSATGVTATVSGSPFSITSATPGPFTSTLTIASTFTSTIGTWSITVTGLYHFDPSCIAAVPASCTGPASTLLQSVTYTLTLVDFLVTSPSAATTFVPYWCSASTATTLAVTGPCPTGNGATATITVAPSGYTGAVTIATAVGTPTPVTVPPLDVGYSVTSIAGASGSSTVTFTNGLLRPTTLVGSYTVRTTLTGTLPSGTRAKTITWIVRPQDFNVTTSNMTPTGPSLQFNSGSSTTDTLTIGSLPSGAGAGVTSAGFAGSVTLSSTIQGGTGLVVTPTTTPVTLPAGQKLTDVVTFTGTVASTTTFTVTITGTATLTGSIPSTTQTHSVTYSVTITAAGPPPDFTVTANPTTVSVVAGTSATSTITVAPTNGFTGTVGLFSTVSSAGLTCTLNPTSIVLGASQTSTLSCVGSAGTYTVTVAGTSGTLTHFATITVTVTPPVVVTIITTLSSSTITIGQSVTDSASLSGNTATAGGTVTYQFFTGSTCSGTGTVVGSPVTVTNGVVPTSAAQTFNTVGSFSWNAVYSGDANNAGATSACELLTVNKAPTTITTTLSSNTISAGGSVTDSATLFHNTGVPISGTVTYSFFSGSTCTGTATVVGTPVSVAGGVVPSSASQTFSNAGSFSWNAIYSGDASNSGSTSACEPLTVNPAISTVTISTTLSPNNVVIVGGSITDSATLAGNTATAGGTVTYNLFSTAGCTGTSTIVSTVTVNNGVVPNSASHTFNSVAPASWNAVYSGDTANSPATSGCEPLTVIKAAPSIATTLSANPITAGGSVFDSAILFGGFQPGGTVTYTFFTGSTCTGTSTVVGSPVTVTNGIVPNSAPQTFAVAGSFSWNAAYSGDVNNAPVSNVCEPLTVNPTSGAALSTSLSANSIPVGSSVTDSATLSGVTANAGGTVTYSFFTGSTCTGTGTVVGGPVAVTNGIVPNSASQTFNTAGPFSWRAVYGGDASNSGTTSGCEPLTVNQAIVTVTTSLSPPFIVVGGSMVDSATLSGNTATAGGTVTYNIFRTSGSCTGTPDTTSVVTVTNGVVPNSASETFTIVAPASWNAVYSGDTNNVKATSACEPFTIQRAATSITTTLSANSITAGSSVTDSAAITGGFQPIGGNVAYNFFTGSVCAGTGTQVGNLVTVTNGVVPNSVSQSFPNAGPFSWQATYSGDGNNVGSTSPCEPLTVNPVAVGINTSLSSTTIVVGGSVTDSATLTGVTSTAGGTVTYSFFSGLTCTGTGTQVGNLVTVTNGVVPNSASQTFAAAGAFSWNAVYSGDANNNGATSSCEPMTVNAVIVVTISTTLSSSSITVGGSVTDSATLSQATNTAGGTVTYSFFTGSSCTGTGTVVGSPVTVTNGIVPNSASQTFNSAGSFSWNAVYSGDANNAGATSLCEPLTVTPLTTATITTSLSSTTITVGGSVFDTATLSGVTANAGGTVTYSVFSGTICGTGRPVGNPVTVANGVVPNSAPMTFMFAGSYSWNAAYSGDANNNAAVSACEPLTVNLVTPTITTSLSASQITVGQSVTDSATLSNGFQAGGFVTYKLFGAGDCSGTSTMISNVTVTNGVVPNSASRLFNTTGTFGWSAVYSGDGNNKGATSACEPLVVSSVTGAPILLSFQAFNFSAFHNGIGPITVLVNGHVVVVFPGHGFVSSSSTDVFGTDKWVSLGPYDITAFVIPGQNNVTFVNTFGIRFSLIRNVMVTQGSTVFLDFKGPRFISSGHPLTLTFSNPPLAITSFTVTGNLVNDSPVTFTATYTGGTAPFKCIFLFGDDEAAFTTGGATSCSVTHHFDDSGTFNVRVIVIGSSTSDRVSSSLSVTLTGSTNQLSTAIAAGTIAVPSDDD